MSQLVFTPPTKETPGFLKRMRKALAFGAALKDNPTPEAMDDMVAFLADYVTEPADRAEAIDALWDATQEQFEQMLSAITGSKN